MIKNNKWESHNLEGCRRVPEVPLRVDIGADAEVDVEAEHGVGAPALPPTSPSVARTREQGQEKVRPESLRSSSIAAPRLRRHPLLRSKPR
jgi:hypothetical protein